MPSKDMKMISFLAMVATGHIDVFWCTVSLVNIPGSRAVSNFDFQFWGIFWVNAPYFASFGPLTHPQIRLRRIRTHNIISVNYMCLA